MTAGAPSLRTGTRDILRLAAPLIASMLLVMLIGVTDVAFLGRVSEAALAAAGLAGVFFFIVVMLGFGYAIALQARMATLNGDGHFTEIGEDFRTGVLFLAALSVVLFAATALLTPPLFALCVDSPAVAEASADYLFWRSAGLPFAYFCAAFRAFYIATLNPRVVTESSVITVLANVALNYVLIFGAGPVPAMGVPGAAIASTLAEGFTLLYFLRHAAKKLDWRRYRLFGKLRFEGVRQLRLFRAARWVMVQEAIACIVWFVFFLVIEHLGEAELALSNIIRQINGVAFLFMHAFGSVCGTLGANLIGAGRAEEIPALCRRGLAVNALFVFLICGFCALFPDEVIGIFTNLPGVIHGVEHGVLTYRIMLATSVLCLPAVHYAFAVEGFGMTRESSIATLIACGAYLAYVLMLARMKASLPLMWTADSIYFITLGLVILRVFRKIDWPVLSRLRRTV